MTLPPNLVIPFSALTADQCRVIAQRGEATVAALGHAKVGRVLRSRLTAAIDRAQADCRPREVWADSGGTSVGCPSNRHSCRFLPDHHCPARNSSRTHRY